MRNTADLTDGKPIAVRSKSISGVSAVNPLFYFTTSMEERERCYLYLLSRVVSGTEQKSYIMFCQINSFFT
jgi:hypothetical protein